MFIIRTITPLTYYIYIIENAYQLSMHTHLNTVKIIFQTFRT